MKQGQTGRARQKDRREIRVKKVKQKKIHTYLSVSSSIPTHRHLCGLIVALYERLGLRVSLVGDTREESLFCFVWTVVRWSNWCC
jgi:hypothetical protein